MTNLIVDYLKIQELIEQFTIPCHPDVLQLLSKEQQSDEPNLDKIIHLVESDVGLSAAVMQVANSPVFLKSMDREQKFSSIGQAIQILGFTRTLDIVKTLSLRDKLRDDHKTLDRFWDSALDVAIVSAYLSQRLNMGVPDEAYMLGLFRDCGLGILLQALPDDYQQLLKKHEHKTDKKIPDIETEVFGINRQAVGYAVARVWRLPEVICRAILTHHDLEPMEADPDSLVSRKNILNCIVLLAEMVSDRFRSLQHSIIDIHEWPAIDPYISDVLNLDSTSILEIMDDALDQMEDLLASYYR